MQIKINGLKWTIQNAKSGSENLKIDGNSCFGVTNYPNLRITLQEEQPIELYRQTVIHELIHAYIFSFGVHLVANENTEEPICDFIGAHLDKIYDHTNLIIEKLKKGGGELEC